MANRRFGPTLGAGVVIREQDADKPIQPAQLGVTAYTGIMERGPIGRLFLASKKKDYQAKAGGYIPESLLPDCAFDFYNLSNGAGELWLQRIVDGTQKAAELVLYSRHPIRQSILKIIAGYQGDLNPGRWAGKKNIIVGEYDSVTAFTLDTGKTMEVNEFKDAILRLSAVPGKSYKVLSNDAAGVLTFNSDVDLVTDIDGDPNQLYSLELSNDGRELSIEVLDGLDSPTTEFGLVAYLNGEEVKRYDNLSMDPDSPRYVEKVINDDTGNYYFKVEDLNSGTVTQLTRPANVYGKIKTVTATVLTADIHEVQASVQNPLTVVGVDSLTYGGSVKRDTLTLTCTVGGAGATFTVASALQGALPNLTEAVAYVTNEYLADFTLNATGAEFTAGDVVVIEFYPWVANEFAGGVLTPDHVNARRTRFEIVSNTVNTITVKTGSDLTAVGAINDLFMVESPQSLGGGYDGIEDVDDTEYIQAYDSGTSPLNSLFGKNKGFVKLATPGVTSTAVQKAGLSYAEAKNYGYRVEIPANIVDEQSAEEYINETIGRNDFGKVHFPSYAYVPNPQGEGLKLSSLTGAFHGREALVAKNYDGYHKVAGGIDVTLPNVIKLPTLDKVLDEELLNPAGINVVKFVKGNAIMWGARSLAIDPAFKFVQQREQLSHYENIFRESFDFIIFAINNATARSRLETSFVTFFLPEFAKGALNGNTFEDAVSIKIDDENNPPEEIAAGNLNAEIKLKLAETVERFVITIGKAGIFEDLSA